MALILTARPGPRASYHLRKPSLCDFGCKRNLLGTDAHDWKDLKGGAVEKDDARHKLLLQDATGTCKLDCSVMLCLDLSGSGCLNFKEYLRNVSAWAASLKGWFTNAKDRSNRWRRFLFGSCGSPPWVDFSCPSGHHLWLFQRRGIIRWLWANDNTVPCHGWTTAEAGFGLSQHPRVCHVESFMGIKNMAPHAACAVRSFQGWR